MFRQQRLPQIMPPEQRLHPAEAPLDKLAQQRRRMFRRIVQNFVAHSRRAIGAESALTRPHPQPQIATQIVQFNHVRMMF